MPDRPVFVRVRRSACRGATAAFLVALAWLLGPSGPLHAQDERRISVEWIFSDAGEEPTQLPPFAWTSDGDVLLLDTRKPKDVRTFERVKASGARSAAVDRAVAWSSLKALLGESGVPESLAWPESLDRAGRRAAYAFADDLFLLDLAASRFERLTRTAEKETVPRLSPDGRRLAFVRGNDLFALDLASRAEIRLTSDGSGTVLNGALSWVYWEEIFDHEDAGFWWSPDGSAIAFLRTDESAVSPVSFGDFRPAVPRVITQRYPKAGGVEPLRPAGHRGRRQRGDGLDGRRGGSLRVRRRGRVVARQPARGRADREPPADPPRPLLRRPREREADPRPDRDRRRLGEHARPGVRSRAGRASCGPRSATATPTSTATPRTGRS